MSSKGEKVSQALTLRWADPEARKKMLEGRWGPDYAKKVNVPGAPRAESVREDVPRRSSKPEGCTLRRIPPRGPIIFCEGLNCFEKCVDFTKSLV